MNQRALQFLVTDSQDRLINIFLKDKTKTIEVRLAKPKYNLSNGNIIIINNSLQLIVTKTIIYKSLKNLLEKENISKIIPNAASLQEALSVFYTFYTKEEEKKYGAIAIHLTNRKI